MNFVGVRNIFSILFFLIGSQLFGGIEQSKVGDSIHNPETVNLLLTKTFYDKSHKMLFQSRYFFMNTNNYNVNAPDFYANGLNNSLSYQSANLLYLFKKLKQNPPPISTLTFNVEYSYLSNIGSSDFSNNNRYEIGLFDIKNPSLKSMGQITNLNIIGRFKNLDFQIGRFVPQSPFINAQDGRLRPTYIQGAIFAYGHEFLPLRLNVSTRLGVANQFLVRGSNEWCSINQSVGIYPSGVNTVGKALNYLNSVNSNNLLFFPSLHIVKSNETYLGTIATYFDSIKLSRTTENSLNYNLVYLNSLFTTHLVELKGLLQVNRKINRFRGTSGLYYTKSTAFSYGFMWIHQNSNSSNSEINYIDSRATSNVFSAMLSLRKHDFSWDYQITAAATRISKDGRYLMPREWGRDPFYTFMPRERNEGFGDLTALTLEAKIERSLYPNFINLKRLSFTLGCGNYLLPDVKDYFYNKYGMPSYQQLNTILNFQFAKNKKPHNLAIQLWYVQKFMAGNTYNQIKYELNKVNMSQVNIVVNYYFTIYYK